MFRLMLVSCVSMIRSVRCIVIVLGRRALWCIANSVLQSRPSSVERPCGSASSCMRSSSFSSSRYRCILSCLMPWAAGWRGYGHHCLGRMLDKSISQKANKRKGRTSLPDPYNKTNYIQFRVALALCQVMPSALPQGERPPLPRACCPSRTRRLLSLAWTRPAPGRVAASP